MLGLVIVSMVWGLGLLTDIYFSCLITFPYNNTTAIYVWIYHNTGIDSNPSSTFSFSFLNTYPTFDF